MPRPQHTFDADQLLAQLGWVKALARRLVVDPNVADDVLQRVCLIALEKPPQDVSGDAGLRRWLSSVTRRLASHAFRGEARRVRRERAAARPEGLPSTADIAERRELLRNLVDALTGLDEPHFSILVHRYFDGLTVADIADQQGISRELVRTRLTRARRRLRARLQRGMGPDRDRWLAALGPMAVPAALSRSPAQLAPWKHLGGLVMAQSTPVLALKSVLALALVSAAALTVWNALDEPPPASTAVAIPLLRLPSPVPISSHPDAAANPSPGAPRELLREEIGAAAADVEHTAEPVALIDRELVLNNLLQLTTQLNSGTLSTDEVLDLSVALLTLLDQAGEPELIHDGRVAQYTLLDSEYGDKVTLNVREVDMPGGTVPEFQIQSDLRTNPGFITGSLNDGTNGTTTTKFDYYLGREDQLSSISLTMQAMTRHSPAFADDSLSMGPMRGGALMWISADKSTWTPMLLEFIERDDGEPSWLNTFGTAITNEPGLDPLGSRSSFVASRLAAVRER